MHDTTDAPEVVDLTQEQDDPQTTPQPQEQPTETAGQDEPGTGDTRAGEARKYRKRAQEAEAERDALRGQLDTLRTTVAERMSGLAKPEALWAAGITLEDVLDDDGNVDETKVQAAVRTASERLGLARGPRPDPTQGARGTPTSSPLQSFTEAFGPRRN